jgi:GH24 family phage-related lysozyme (muramidase)
MLYDKRKGSLLNYIQLPLNVITPSGTYLGVGYDEINNPKYILSHVKVKTFSVVDLVFSELSKREIMNDIKPVLQIKPGGNIGYRYEISETELRYGYITVSSTRIPITNGMITTHQAELLLEKQLRSIGNVIEKFVRQPLGQSQFDALVHHFYYEGADTIENSYIIKLINLGRWYEITDEIQSNIKRKNGKVDDRLAIIRIRTAKMWSYVPGFS